MAPQCPSEDRLAALLDETLSPEEFQVSEAHVAECAACQASLERLSAFTWREWRIPVASSSGAPFSNGSTVEIPGHEIQEEIGRGGHGVVFRAIDRLLDRPVALKVIRHGVLASEAERRGFLAEARAAARIRNPHIIPIYAVGERGGQPYFTMELAAGGGLDRRLAEGPIGIRDAAQLVERLARAVHHAHERGVIHRDLKPANILLADETLDQPLIADFGVARIPDSPTGRTPSGSSFGTPGYMAPEQAEGGMDAVGPTADVFSLGAILYELLVGRPPFRGSTPFETLLQTRRREPAPPSKSRPDLSRDLESICLKCLRKRPDERYQSAAELADDLRRHLDGAPVRGPEEGGATHRRAGRRYVRPAAALAAILALVPIAAWVAPPVSRWVDGLDDIAERVREASPPEIPSLQAALRSDGLGNDDRLWVLLDELLASRHPGALAAAAVLAGPAPDDARWASRARPVADLLIEADDSKRSAWSDWLRPISTPLVGALVDRLADAEDDPENDRDARLRAARILLNFATGDDGAASLLAKRLAEFAAPLPEATVVERAKRAGRLGAALILAGDDHFARPLLSRSPNPTARSRLIDSLGRNRGDLGELLLEWAAREPDPGSRQALVLAVGRRSGAASTDARPLGSDPVVEELLRFYRDDPDSGVHSAAEWALLRWGMLPLIRIERNLLAAASPPKEAAGDRGWYVGPRRHTLAILRPPSERAFAIATNEVSALQLKEFLEEHPGYQSPPIQKGFPAHPVPLSMARAYCNWLSRQDGLDDEQLCYEPSADGLFFEPIDGFMDRRGYRIPTEKEWLFACWGKAATPFPYGHGEEFFDAYGRASADVPVNVSRFMPNDHGLFDMLGNASEWCEIPSSGSAVARGGSYLLPPSVAPAYRLDPDDDPEAGRTVGFRVARTVR